MGKHTDLEGLIDEALLRHLPKPDAKFAIAFSGGGDSVALVHSLRAYAARGHVMIVDHGLRRGSKAEALAAQNQAKSWGFNCDILTWESQQTTTAIQEKARHARYNLMGDRLRALGIRYLLTGHTQGDQAETCLMRYERKTGWRGAAGMREKAYAPLWPALARVELIRPLLSCSRQSLRAYNQAHKLDWADDPSNDNTDFARILARQYLANKPDLTQLFLTTANEMQNGLRQEQQDLQAWLRKNADISDHGYVRLKARPRKVELGRLIHAVSGSGGVIDASALAALWDRMGRSDFKAATLSGCQVTTNQAGFLLVCEARRAKGRRELNEAPQGREYSSGTYIWDNRFLVSYTGKKTVRAQHAFGHINRLTDYVRTVPVAARVTLPLIRGAQGEVLAVGSHESENLTVRWLGRERLMDSISP